VSSQPPISGTTAIVGVLGDPVHHSLSPVMQNAALQAMGLDWVFLALPAPAGELATVVRALEALDCRGLNVTIPHKHSVAALCRELSPLAQRLGAVNVLVPLDGGGWHGTNTDVEGFCAPLRRDGRQWQGQRAVVLGCGGSARAVVAGLVELGCGRITLAGRRPEVVEGCDEGDPTHLSGVGGRQLIETIDIGQGLAHGHTVERTAMDDLVAGHVLRGMKIWIAGGERLVRVETLIPRVVRSPTHGAQFALTRGKTGFERVEAPVGRRVWRHHIS
jgi:hypothetical protein